MDAVWLMGVWERGRAGIDLAMESPAQVASFRAALPDFDDTDVIGSAYCISRYEVDQRLGGRAGLAVARAALARRGVRLLVDFVPNHVAPDHPWLAAHPEYFVQGTSEDLATDPAGFIAVGDAVIARGRDPTSRHGPTSPSSTRSRPASVGPSSRPSTTSPSRRTACAATWRCCC